MKVDDTGNEMHPISSDEVEIAKLQERIDVMEAALHHLYTNCPLTPVYSLKKNPNMLGDDENKCWMQADKVFNVFARYGFDDDYFDELNEKLGEPDGW